MPKKLDLLGQRFEKLEVIKQLPSKNGHTYWLCKCECGKEKEIQTTNLTSGATKSCGMCNKKSGFISNKNIEKQCPICNKIFNTNAVNRKYCYECSPSESGTGKASIKERKRAIKHQLVLYKGGKCQKCGYNKCEGALQFHHRDSKEKDFGIAQIHLNSEIDMSILYKEVDKCDLLCANCHAEEHYLEDTSIV